MINNKQVNLWRGTDTPPTIYHIWVKDEAQLLLYNGSAWVVFIDDKKILEELGILKKLVESHDSDIKALKIATVNNIPILENPVLDASKIENSPQGFLGNNVEESLLNINELFTTKIIEK